MKQLIDWIAEDPRVRVPLVVAIIGLCGVVIGGFLTQLFLPLVKTMFVTLWTKLKVTSSARSFEGRYLDWVINEHQYLPALPTTLASFAERKKYELDRFYVSLAVTEDVQAPHGISLDDALRDHDRLVILGDPGAGKTTMLRFVALTLAKARRERAAASKDAEYKADVSSFREARRRVRENFGYDGFPLPVFVYLNRLRNVTEWSEGRSILDALHSEWMSVDLRDFPPRFFDEKLQRGECVFLFDAYDELGTQDARDSIAERIGALASGAPPGNRFIVTSRIVGYNGQLDKYGFDALTVQRLSWDLVGQLVRRWYASVDESSLADQLLTTLKANRRIYELAVNPMLLSLIVLVQYHRRLIPDQRHVLYEECVRILVERRYAPYHVQAEYIESFQETRLFVSLEGLRYRCRKNAYERFHEMNWKGFLSRKS